MRILLFFITIILGSNATFAQQTISCERLNIHATLLSVQGDEAQIKVSTYLGGAYITSANFNLQNSTIAPGNAPGVGGAGNAADRILSENTWTVQKTDSLASIIPKMCPTAVLNF